MIARRDLLIGAACLAGAGAAAALQPRRHVALLDKMTTLDAVVPRVVGPWTARDVGDLVAPKTEGSLLDKLYSQTVERTYQNASTGAEIMMLLAYGDTQSNDLQLHRPEVCYPAFGFKMSNSRVLNLPLANGVLLPSRQLVANAPSRQECIIYWSRLGEFLPTDGIEQRRDRLATSMSGIVADGLLARFSILGADPGQLFGVVQSFITALVTAVVPAQRAALVGTSRAQAMAAVK